MKPFQDSHALIGDAEALRAQAARDGYLFLPGLLPRDDVLAARRALLPDLARLGWIAQESPDDDRAIANLDNFTLDTDPVVSELVCRHGVLPAVQRLQHHPALTGVAEKLFAEPVLPLPRIIFRYLFPQKNEHATPQHQDFPHVQGTTRTFTAWVPLGDCPAALGGLQIAAGSQKGGVLPLHPALGAGGMEVPGDFEEVWCGGEMRAGDVLMFNALTVHRGAANTSDRMRLSVDMRYQPLSEPVTEDWLHPHRRHLDWETLYADVDDDTYKYYWRDMDLKVAPFDKRYYDARDAMAFEMAEAGDIRAEATLHRIANNYPDTAMRARARAALAHLETAGQ